MCGQSFSRRALLNKHVELNPGQHEAQVVRSIRQITDAETKDPDVFLEPLPVLEQCATHNTTLSNKASILAHMEVRASAAVSKYDGKALLEMKDDVGCAYFHVAPGNDALFPFSSFPRSASSDTPCALLCLSLKHVDRLVRDQGAKLFHVSTAPSQTQHWNRRNYQTHVVVACDKRDHEFFKGREDTVELDPDDNCVFFRVAVDGSWSAATKFAESPGCVRRAQVVLAFCRGVKLEPDLIHWVEPSYKLTSQKEGSRTFFTCPSCGRECKEASLQKFWTMESLKRHYRTKHLDANLVCPRDGCDQAFKSNIGLQEHIVSVHEGTRFACEQPGCLRVFKHASTLRKHIQSVHEGKSFRCRSPGCTKEFSLPENRRRHERTVHSDAVLSV